MNSAQRFLDWLAEIPTRIQRYPEVADELKHVRQRKADLEDDVEALERQENEFVNRIQRLEEDRQRLQQRVTELEEDEEDETPALSRDALLNGLSDYDWTYRTSHGRIAVKNYLPDRDELDKWWDEAQQEFNPDISLSAQGIVDYWFKLNAEEDLGWTYKRDGAKHSMPEVWEDPWTAWNEDGRTGDCETKSGVLAGFILSHMREAGVLEDNWHRLLFWAGRTLSEGHACLKWWADDGDFYTVESTLYQEKSFETTWLNTAVYDHYFYYDSFGLATMETSHKSDLYDLKRIADEAKQ